MSRDNYVKLELHVSERNVRGVVAIITQEVRREREARIEEGEDLPSSYRGTPHDITIHPGGIVLVVHTPFVAPDTAARITKRFGAHLHQQAKRADNERTLFDSFTFELRQATVNLITAIESNDPDVIVNACKRANTAITAVDSWAEVNKRPES